jgi:hypothetical protein
VQPMTVENSVLSRDYLCVNTQQNSMGNFDTYTLNRGEIINGEDRVPFGP